MPTPASPPPASSPRWRAGSRGSPLALVQTKMVVGALVARHGLADEAFAIRVVHTQGDKVRDRPLADIGGKAVWTKEIDRALLARDINFAVHSLKDVETQLDPAIVIAAVLERADPRDCLIGAASLAALPAGAIVGTSSPRRAAMVRAHRPDLGVVNLRGNVGTRLKRIAEGRVNATLLAMAGLTRLGATPGTPLPVDDWLPAVGQGVIAITCRRDDAEMRRMLTAIDHAPTRVAMETERAFLAAVGGNCHSAIGVHARPDGDSAIRLDAELLSADGRDRIRDHIIGPTGDREALARALAGRMMAGAGPSIRASLA